MIHDVIIFVRRREAEIGEYGCRDSKKDEYLMEKARFYSRYAVAYVAEGSRPRNPGQSSSLKGFRPEELPPYFRPQMTGDVYLSH